MASLVCKAKSVTGAKSMMERGGRGREKGRGGVGGMDEASTVTVNAAQKNVPYDAEGNLHIRTVHPSCSLRPYLALFKSFQGLPSSHPPFLGFLMLPETL